MTNQDEATAIAWCSTVIRDAGVTEVEPGTITRGDRPGSWRRCVRMPAGGRVWGRGRCGRAGVSELGWWAHSGR